MSHSGPAVRTVPWVLNLPHVKQELLHLTDTQGRANHHLQTDKARDHVSIMVRNKTDLLQIALLRFALVQTTDCTTTKALSFRFSTFSVQHYNYAKIFVHFHSELSTCGNCSFSS